MKKTLLIATLLLAPAFLQGAATIVIVNGDEAGVGFNDATPAAPVGGNTGTTVGAQRLNVFKKAAQIWGAAVTSTVPIKVFALWPDLFCDSTSAVLGAAGATSVFANFPNAPVDLVWYPQALANKLAKDDLAPDQEDIIAFFNVNLGNPGCLTGRPFYLGLDGNAPPTTINFLTTLLHEIGHGLGFQTFTDVTDGSFLAGLPSVADLYLLDKTTNQTWAFTSAFVRQQSAVNGMGKLVWNGPNVKAGVPSVLVPAPELRVTSPPKAAETYIGGPSTLGPLPAVASGELMPVTSVLGGGNACAPLTGFDAAAINGKIAVIDRGGCPFVTKFVNAQNAGAKAVVLVNNVPDIPPMNITAYDPSVTIPTMIISQADGAALNAALQFRSRTSSGVFANIGPSATIRAGADSAHRVIMYAPSTLRPGSSVSHYDISAFKNLLMEPFINPDLTLSVRPPQDLTYPFLQDIGW